ncbi:MAG: DUF4173 domain-containing protein [Candidatus Limnocylindrales bacterium]
MPTATWAPPPAPAVPFVQRLTDRLAARAIVISLFAGFLAQLLLFSQRPGVNWPIWIAAVIAAAVITRRPAARIDRADIWLPIGALTFAAFIAFRDDPGLFTFDLLASSTLTLASVVAIGGLPVTRNTWLTIGRLGGSAVLMFWVGAARMLHGFRPVLAALPAFGGSSTSRRVARGLLIALPLVITFVALFAAADAVFQNLLRSTFDFRLDLSEWVGRFVFGLTAAWFLGGTLVAGWLTRDRFPNREVAGAGTDRQRPLSSVEAVTVVGVLDVLFAIFVIIQAAYLFPGGDPLSASGLTYAEYARRGFFELVVVAVLSGAVILALDWLVDRATLSFKLATAGLALMTGIVLISAAVRLDIYQQVYGWTELRFYVLAAIAMLAFGVVVTIVAITARRVGAVPKLVLAGGLVIALACNVIGPQAFVTTHNVERAANPELVPADGFTGLDTRYIAGLSADVVPSLVQSLDQLPPDARAQVVVLLRRTAYALRADATGETWQSWNLSRQRALDALLAAGF